MEVVGDLDGRGCSEVLELQGVESGSTENSLKEFYCEEQQRNKVSLEREME